MSKGNSKNIREGRGFELVHEHAMRYGLVGGVELRGHHVGRISISTSGGVDQEIKSVSCGVLGRHAWGTAQGVGINKGEG